MNTVDTATAPTLQPLVLVAPEMVAPVAPAQVQSAVVLPEETRTAQNLQAQAFVQALRQEDLGSDAFQAKLDEAFALGRKEIANATTLSNGFTEQNFAHDTGSPVFAAMEEMRTLFEELNPSKQGDLLANPSLFGMKLPFANKLKRYLRRYDSARDQIDALYTHLVNAQMEVGVSVRTLQQSQQQLWQALQSLEGAAAFIAEVDRLVVLEVQQLQGADPLRAKALEQEVLYYVRQNLSDVRAAQALTVNAYQVAGELRKTGREVINGCDRVMTLGMAALSVAVTLAKATGVQVQTLQMLSTSKKTIEDLIGATGDALQSHVTQVTQFASDPLLGVKTIEDMFSKTLAAMQTMEEYRSTSLDVMAQNNAVLKGHIESHLARIQSEHTAALPSSLGPH